MSVEKNTFGEDFNPVPYLAGAVINLLALNEGIVIDGPEGKCIVYHKENDLLNIKPFSNAFEDPEFTKPLTEVDVGDMVWVQDEEFQWN
jgi:hypothetical protein